MHGTAGLYYVSNPVSCIIIYDAARRGAHARKVAAGAHVRLHNLTVLACVPRRALVKVGAGR